jgi:hypothetical protein
MLFLQGTRDPLARRPLLKALHERLGGSATLRLLPEAEHSFHVPVRSGRTDAEVREEMVTALAAWIDSVILA